MKKKLLILITAACCLLSCTDGLWNAIEDLNNKYKDLDGRVSRLEELCKEMNTNIAALQTLVNVMLGNDYIVSITPIMKEDKEIGYVITFAIHDPITIYHGQNGADGKDGKDGQDGVTPLISVALDSTDNAYYWTLNGDWLLDANGNRIPLTSRDGRDGQDGQDGADGITPQLKIENGYWYVSTDNGVTWTQLGKATGDNGRNGVDGHDGQDGDSMFLSVTQDADFVYFTLANGTVLKISKYKDDRVQIIDGAIMAEFSVSETQKVYFSMGNLQYNATLGTHLCADGTTKSGTWRFALNQEDSLETGWVDKFMWGSSGTSISTTQDVTMTGQYANLDWGVYNAISNGGNQPNQWRTLSDTEWRYLLDRAGGSMWMVADVYFDLSHSNRGILLFPDNYSPFPISHTFYSVDRYLLPIKTISPSDWDALKSQGVIFINIRPYYEYINYNVYFYGICWTSRRLFAPRYVVRGHGYSDNPSYYDAEEIMIYAIDDASTTCSVRLVKNVE